MFIYFSMLSGLLPIIFILSAIGLIYSFIKKKRKTPWVLGIVGSIIFISIMILFMDEIISRIDMPNDEIKETSEDPEGTLRVKEGKYIVGEKIKEGLYNIRFQDDTGSIHLVNLYTEGDFRDGTAFGKNKEFRLFLKKGDGLKFTGIPIITPTTYEKMNYERVEITAGYWTVGKTIAPGKYKIEDV
ncbi:MAG: hypothetical protein ACTHW2_01895, partial [Tissierella sp.]|uniref:hypothetical protein n=1 Tax=Tissierella sp. TaxID=41274 RepID=UPI003F9684FA